MSRYRMERHYRSNWRNGLEISVSIFQRKEKTMLYVGVDLGTSAVKLLLMDSEGKIRKIVSKEYPLYFPHPGWSEQNRRTGMSRRSRDWKELLEGSDKSELAGISFGGQMHGLVILDKDDQVIRPAILWNDGRTSEETDYLNNVIGKESFRVHGKYRVLDLPHRRCCG